MLYFFKNNVLRFTTLVVILIRGVSFSNYMGVLMNLKKLNLIFLLLTFVLCFATPPHPKKFHNIQPQKNHISQKFGPQTGSKNNLPQNVLVLRCNFSDVQMVDAPTYPDSMAHDFNYFDIYMKHLKDYYLDASHDQYEISYTIHPTVVNLTKLMGYYGDDSIDGERRPEMMKDVIEALDSQINFSQYDAFILFHAGGGQESDINDTQANAIWSTFLSKSDLREYFDKDNMSYQGIATNDGVYVSEMVIVPEWQRHPDFPVTDDPITDAYIFDIMGVLAHQFGHQIGLPTLFDNVSANGSSAGIGNFGLMGTAVWNNNGKTPALPSAWERYYMGWETPVVIMTDKNNLKITHPMASTPELVSFPKLFKLPISDKEYFLIENRQQNFIKDSVWIQNDDFPNGIWWVYPLHSFELAPSGIQDYYPGTEIPIVNMLENNLRRSEWDYFMPYIDAQTEDYQDGSGLFIWHIDENIINQTFTADFELNHPNGDALHKGVDLEEADGIQHLDSARPDYYMRGSPFDSFRKENKDYFGKKINPNNNLISLPTSESYYGGQSIEIYDISTSGDLMSFSVRFNNQIKTNGNSTHLPPFAGNLAKSKTDQLIYFDDQAKLYVIENGNETVKETLPYSDSLYQYYTKDTASNILLIPTESKIAGQSDLYKWDGQNLTELIHFDDYVWATHTVAVKDTLFWQSKEVRYILALNQKSDTNSKIVLLTAEGDTVKTFKCPGVFITSNMTYKDKEIHFLSNGLTGSFPSFFNSINLLSMEMNSNNIQSSNGSSKNSTQNQSKLSSLWNFNKVIALLQGNFFGNDQNNFAVVKQNEDHTFSLCFLSKYGDLISNHFALIDKKSLSIPIIADIDNNGSLDIVIGNEDGYQAYAQNLTLLNPYQSIEYPDSTGQAGGFINIRHEGLNYMIGNISHNRLSVWSDQNKPVSGYPVSFSSMSYSAPLPVVDNDSLWVYIAGQNGFIYKHYLQDISLSSLDGQNWLYAFGGLERHAAWTGAIPENTTEQTGKIVKGMTYIYPNPWNRLSNNDITLQVTTAVDTKAKVSVYNISGNLVYQKSDGCAAYIPNRTSFKLNPAKLSSGVYIAIVKAGSESYKIKFAIEK